MKDDMISRQAALDAITDELMPSTPLSAVIRAKNRLKDLPTVQPDHTADISKKVEGDCISRQMAIDMLKNRWKKTRNYEGIGDDIAEECELYLKQVPSAQPEHVADIGKKVCVDTISRQAALKKLAVYIHLIDKTMGKGLLTDDDCMEAAKSVLGEDELPAAQPEIIRCKNCKYMIDTGDDLMCDNAKGWVVATTSDFGCVLAERRTDGQG